MHFWHFLAFNVGGKGGCVAFLPPELLLKRSVRCARTSGPAVFGGFWGLFARHRGKTSLFGAFFGHFWHFFEVMSFSPRKRIDQNRSRLLCPQRPQPISATTKLTSPARPLGARARHVPKCQKMPFSTFFGVFWPFLALRSSQSCENSTFAPRTFAQKKRRKCAYVGAGGFCWGMGPSGLRTVILLSFPTACTTRVRRCVCRQVCCV